MQAERACPSRWRCASGQNPASPAGRRGRAGPATASGVVADQVEGRRRYAIAATMASPVAAPVRCARRRDVRQPATLHGRPAPRSASARQLQRMAGAARSSARGHRGPLRAGPGVGLVRYRQVPGDVVAHQPAARRSCRSRQARGCPGRSGIRSLTGRPWPSPARGRSRSAARASTKADNQVRARHLQLQQGIEALAEGHFARPACRPGRCACRIPRKRTPGGPSNSAARPCR